MDEYKNILVHCETSGGRLTPLATELLGAGRRLARDLGEQLCAVLIGAGISGLAREAIAFGADRVYVIDDPALGENLSDPVLTAVEKVVKQSKPQAVLFGQTPLGRDIAPRLAFRLGTAASLDCVALEIDKESKRLIQTRPVFGGNALGVYVCATNPQIAAVRSKAVSPIEKDPSRQGEVVAVALDTDAAAGRTRLVERKVEAGAGVKLEEARVVVAGGRGIGSADGFKQLEELAGLLKGAVGATRPPCDNGWVSDSQQIGLTGKVVSPDLYFAVAISGASQHLSGCSGSKVIVAINKDPEANIFKAAQYGIVADWKSVIPALISKIRELISGKG